ncbi:MAG: hypothetical protein LBK82_16520 [Planctomycetaceae bacterium]|jgi:hypothetical protein|nr:hypothetical protein [Planctomycetaceae bacterium]
MEKFLNMLFNMPIEFQIGSAVALVFFVLSWLLLLLRRDNVMISALFISFLICVAFCRLPMVPLWGHIFGTFIVYGLTFTCQVILPVAKIKRQKEQKLYSSDYESVAVDPFEFTWLNLDYYDTKQRELESFGFKKVGDYESLPYTKADPDARFFTRKFDNIHYDIVAEVSQVRTVKPKNVVERMVSFRVVAFTTEFSDGTFLSTSNVLGINRLNNVEGIVLRKFSPNTPLEILLDTHEKEIEKICEIKNLKIVLHRNAEELYATGKRRFLLLCKDHQKKYGFTPEGNTQHFTATQNINNDSATEICLSEYNKQARKIEQEQRKNKNVSI